PSGTAPWSISGTEAAVGRRSSVAVRRGSAGAWARAGAGATSSESAARTGHARCDITCFIVLCRAGTLGAVATPGGRAAGRAGPEGVPEVLLSPPGAIT